MTTNKTLLKKVRKLIVEEPKRLQMRTWGSYKDSYRAKANGFKPEDFPSCGTVACLAGWTVLAGLEPKYWKTRFDVSGGLKARRGFAGVDEEAAHLLGLESHEAYDVFHHMSWKAKDVIRWIDQKLAEKK